MGGLREFCDFLYRSYHVVQGIQNVIWLMSMFQVNFQRQRGDPGIMKVQEKD